MMDRSILSEWNPSYAMVDAKATAFEAAESPSALRFQMVSIGAKIFTIGTNLGLRLGRLRCCVRWLCTDTEPSGTCHIMISASGKDAEETNFPVYMAGNTVHTTAGRMMDQCVRGED